MAKPKRVLEVLNLSDSRWQKDGVAQNELALLKAEALAQAGLSLSAQYVLTELITGSAGTDQSQRALMDLAKMAKTDDLDEQSLEIMALHFDGALASPEASTMVAYLKWKALSARGMKDWAARAYSEIGTDNLWQGDLQYLSAQADVAANNIDQAIQLFRKVGDDEKNRTTTRQSARLQLARLLFEGQDFSNAFKTYQILDLPLRERGRALLEMAWSQYYVKNYSESLGILHALRNPVFDSSITPERYILQMLILRDLCHYDEVKTLEEIFHSEYNPIYKVIEARGAYETNDRIASLALLDLTLQKSAYLIAKLRKERAVIQGLHLNDKKAQNALVAHLNEREVDLRFLLEREIRRKAPDTLIDQREQIKFIGYSSTIQSKSASSRKVEYLGVNIPSMKYQNLYWPVRYAEFWWDEVSYYRALITSNCGTSPAPAKGKP